MVEIKESLSDYAEPLSGAPAMGFGQAEGPKSKPAGLVSSISEAAEPIGLGTGIKEKSPVVGLGAAFEEKMGPPRKSILDEDVEVIAAEIQRITGKTQEARRKGAELVHKMREARSKKQVRDILAEAEVERIKEPSILKKILAPPEEPSPFVGTGIEVV